MSKRIRLVADLQKLAEAEKAALGVRTKATLDRKLIVVDQEHEVRYWTYVLGCTEEELRRAVADVGNSVQEVRAYFGSGDLPLPQTLWD